MIRLYIYTIEIILSNTVDRVAGNARSMRIIVSRKKNHFLSDFIIKKRGKSEGSEKIKVRRARKSHRLSKIRRTEGAKRKWQETDYNLFCASRRCETINKRRPHSRWRSFSARVRARSMPHYNPLTINELLMKWNGRRCRPHRPTGAPEMGGSLWFPSENGNVRRPDATTHPPFSNSLSLSLDRYHRPSRN